MQFAVVQALRRHEGAHQDEAGGAIALSDGIGDGIDLVQGDLAAFQRLHQRAEGGLWVALDAVEDHLADLERLATGHGGGLGRVLHQWFCRADGAGRQLQGAGHVAGRGTQALIAGDFDPPRVKGLQGGGGGCQAQGSEGCADQGGAQGNDKRAQF
ncbi:hypothetical protein D3C86_1626970 [compost metagenome]